MKTVAIIGCGKVVPGKEGWAIGHTHAGAWQHNYPEIQLHGVDITPDNLAQFGERFNIPSERLHKSEDALYATVAPDVVSICTWPSLHAPMVHRAIAEGVKRIVCEKPISLSPREVREIQEAATANNVSISVAHQRRHNPMVAEIRKLISTKRLGDSVVLEFRVTENWDILSWTSHWFDLANCIMDGPPLGLIAGIDHQGQRRYQHAVENQSVVFAEYPGGHQAIFITGPDNPGVYPITIRGEHGVALVDEVRPLKILTEQGIEHIPLDEEACQYEILYGKIFSELFHSREDGTTPLCDLSRTVDGTLMCFAVHESSCTQKRVEWPLHFDHAPLEILQHPPENNASAK